MCTVTVIRQPDDLIRIAINRDEKRTRPTALPPRLKHFGERQAILPIDSAAGGTWAAVNDAGIAFVLLNQNPDGGPDWTGSCRKSRGLIIPLLLHCDSVVEAMQTASYFKADQFGPFRLIVVDRGSIGQVDSDGFQHVAAINPLGDEPLMFTSSSLGDRLVDGPRRTLFESTSFHSARAQDHFHRHIWPAAPHLSVCMTRDDARTVSFSIIELRSETVRFAYHADAPDRPAKLHCVSLPSMTASAV